MGKPDYDTTLARMAGNIAAALLTVGRGTWDETYVAGKAVSVARAIVAEIKRTAASRDPVN